MAIWQRNIAATITALSERETMINRETLAALYLDRVNNYLTNTTFADHLGLHEDEARKLLEVAKSCFENDHPDQ